MATALDDSMEAADSKVKYDKFVSTYTTITTNRAMSIAMGRFLQRDG